MSLKKALAVLGFKGGTRNETERNQWVTAEKERLRGLCCNMALSGRKREHMRSIYLFWILRKKERAKEVAELEQTISGSKEELSDILLQQVAAGRETEQIRKEGEMIRQELSELTATNHMLKEQAETLTEDKEKLLSENEKLEKQQKKLQQEINKMVRSKEVMERNIHAYDEDVKWQLAEPGALMSAKNYRDKKALPLVGKLKEVVKNLTIKCVQLTEQSRKLTAKVDGQTVRCVGEVAIESTTFILALFQFDGLLLPCVEHIEHGRVSGIVGLVKAQADFPVNFHDFQPVHIFQRKERVHKPNKGINIRHGKGVGAYIKDIRHFFYKVVFRCPRFCFILCHTGIRGLSEKAEDFT